MTKINNFISRLKKLNIHVVLHGNFPWIYLYSINDVVVRERQYGNHGFTVFMLGYDHIKTMGPSETFKLIRKYITK